MSAWKGIHTQQSRLLSTALERVVRGTDGDEVIRAPTQKVTGGTVQGT